MLIRGDKLNAKQREQVLRTFVHRWTHENADQNYRGRCPACVQYGHSFMERHEVKAWHERHAPLTTDAEWLAKYAFHFVKDGSRMMANKGYAEPASMAS